MNNPQSLSARHSLAVWPKSRTGGKTKMAAITTLILEYLDAHGASHIHEMHIEIINVKPGTPEHTVRARLSEAVSEGMLQRLGDGFYDIYAEDEDMTSVISYPNRCSLWGNNAYKGNCDGRLIKNLILRYNAKNVADPMMGSGTSRDVVAGLNKYKKTEIKFWGSDLKSGFDLTKQNLPDRYDFVWLHPPYWNIIEYTSIDGDLSTIADYQQFKKMLHLCLQRCYEALLPGGRMAILVADVRKQGRYTPLIKDLLEFPNGELRSIIIKVQHNCASDRKFYGKLEDVPIKHEYCVVFKKSLNL
jgi:hypothetical protein